MREARLARELGVELIVTDHHTIGPELPEADVVVHPRLPGSAYPFADLCGAGVAFKLAWQICKSFGDGKKASPHLRDFLVKSLGLVALATVADMVPLEGENRLIVRHGLGGIDARPTVGLRALMEVSGLLEKKRRLTAGTVGFNLAPRINAAGRLECARMAVEMLTTDDTAHAREHRREARRVQPRAAGGRAHDRRRGAPDDRGPGGARRPRRDRPGEPRAGTPASSASWPAAWSRPITAPPSSWPSPMRSARGRRGRSRASTSTRRSRPAPRA